MKRDIQPVHAPGNPAPASSPSIGGIDLYGALLADARKPDTQAARKWDMIVLAQYLGLVDPEGNDDPAGAARLFCGGTAGQANAVAIGFKRHLIDKGQASSTVNRRLCTLRTLAKLARRLGVIDWTPEVDGLPDEPARDMAGPSDEDWRKILAVATKRAEGGSEIGMRDLAIIRLMHDNGLRCGEVSALDLVDVDLAAGRVNVLGKGKRSKSWITINDPTSRALAAWLAIRGSKPGAFFLKMCRIGPGARWNGSASSSGGPGRISTRGFHRIVTSLGKEAGVDCRPHGLRHSGATRLLDLTGGDVRAVQRWTRHKSVETVLKYDDNRRDLAGDLARKLGQDGGVADGNGGLPC